MADQQKVVKRRKKKEAREENNEPTKEEQEVGKYLRFNCPSKTSTMMGQKVEYFIGSKAVDCLMDSKWASGKGGAEILFTDRVSVELYLDRLLILNFFERVVRIKKVKKSEEEKKKEKEKEEQRSKEKEESDSKKTKKKQKKEEGKKVDDDSGEGKQKSAEKSSQGEGKKKLRKVKVKLEPHEEQIFVDDDDEAYVWIFDPIHPKTFVMGVLVVIATIAICLFPLWPYNIREYVWYLSVIAAALVGSILVLAVLRYVFFAIVWVCTWGKHHFWLLPNLTEECGFFESFVPLYTHEYMGNKDEDKPAENENENVDEKDDEKEEGEGKKEESSEDKDHTEKEPWVKLTEEEVATARSEVDKEVKGTDETLATEVKC